MGGGQYLSFMSVSPSYEKTFNGALSAKKLHDYGVVFLWFAEDFPGGGKAKGEEAM